MPGCSFCAGSMTTQHIADTVDTMETGGMWRQDRFECASCAGVVVRDLVLKLGGTRESWTIESLPAQITAHTALRCPACSAPIASAWPPDVAPAPTVTAGAGHLGQATRESEHVCVGCRARYRLVERIEPRWYDGEGYEIASPR